MLRRMTALLSPREWALLVALFAPLALFFAVGPVAQDPRYHAFADGRALLGVPNFANVASNVFFLIFGLAGIAVALRRRAGASASWLVMFAGAALVSAGSSYYHASPNDGTLVWDRLPMTLAFMGLLVALIAEHVSAALERKLLVPALMAGVFSVLWWHFTGDLRLYVWVQAAPLLAVIVLPAAYPARYSHRGWLVCAFVFYALAKAAESSDAAIFDFTGGWLSGHSLKHIAASFAPLFMALMLARRSEMPSTRPGRQWN
jgi:hypothetical protein